MCVVELEIGFEEAGLRLCVTAWTSCGSGMCISVNMYE
jgi:hypothetical protein